MRPGLHLLAEELRRDGGLVEAELRAVAAGARLAVQTGAELHRHAMAGQRAAAHADPAAGSCVVAEARKRLGIAAQRDRQLRSRGPAHFRRDTRTSRVERRRKLARQRIERLRHCRARQRPLGDGQRQTAFIDEQLQCVARGHGRCPRGRGLRVRDAARQREQQGEQERERGRQAAPQPWSFVVLRHDA